MPIAALLLREESNNSLKSSVERAQQRKPPLLEYDLQLTSYHLELTLVSKPSLLVKPPHPDEGFESDIDTVSIVSSNDSFALTNTQEENGSKTTTETDSANGSASSDSDTEIPLGVASQNENASKSSTLTPHTCDSEQTNKSASNGKSSTKHTDDFSQSSNEIFNLVDCLCYTDVKFPNILLFVIKNETLVFRFDNLKHLQNFYTNFSALKAVTNQKTYNKATVGTKFNLLQRTDNNGVTHIQITRETGSNFNTSQNISGPSSIMSINTPEDCLDRLINSVNERSSIFDVEKESLIKSDQSSESNITNETTTVSKNSHDVSIEKYASSDNLLGINDSNKLVKENNGNNIGKAWNSAENLLDTPKKPDRKKRLKGKAPPPPVNKPKPPEEINDKNSEDKDILSGQFVRVNVNFEPKETQKQLIIKSHLKEPHPKKLQNFNILSTKPSLSNFLNPKPKLLTYQQFKNLEPKKAVETATLQRIKYKPDSSWTNSVPRLLKKHRSKSETRNFTPMAYRYIDTTQNSPFSYGVPQASCNIVSNIFGSNSSNRTNFFPNSQTISNRLFGLSPKLKEFNSNDLRRDRWGSMSDICFKGDNNLKSVIKKDESKKKNEKKVTFSAYTTVQVV